MFYMSRFTTHVKTSEFIPRIREEVGKLNMKLFDIYSVRVAISKTNIEKHG